MRATTPRNPCWRVIPRTALSPQWATKSSGRANAVETGSPSNPTTNSATRPRTVGDLRGTSASIWTRPSTDRAHKWTGVWHSWTRHDAGNGSRTKSGDSSGNWSANSTSHSSFSSGSSSWSSAMSDASFMVRRCSFDVRRAGQSLGEADRKQCRTKSQPAEWTASEPSPHSMRVPRSRSQNGDGPVDRCRATSLCSVVSEGQRWGCVESVAILPPPCFSSP